MPVVWGVSVVPVGVLTDPWSTLDGRLNAPAGPAQYPTLLNSYSVRPPWHVAGVDYRVGYPVGQTFKVPGVDALPNGCDIVGGGIFVNSDSGNIVDGLVLDGWDFEAGSIYGVLVFGGNNVTITNNHFGTTRLQWRVDGHGPIGGTIMYNVFDQGGLNVGSQLSPYKVDCPGLYTFQYNWIRNAYAVMMQCSADQIFDCRFNIIETAGCGAFEGAHGDWIQWGGGSITLGIKFCLIYQAPFVGASTQGFSLAEGGGGPPTYVSGEITNNAYVIVDGAVNYANLVARQYCQVPFIIQDNYVDPTELSNWLQDYTAFPGPFPSGVITVSNNTNMLTGAAYP